MKWVCVGGGMRAKIWGQSELSLLEIRSFGGFPGGPVVKTPCVHCRGHGFYPWSGN